MTEQEMSNIGWNPCYTTVCISLSGSIVRSGDKEIMAKYAKDNNFVVARIEILSFDEVNKNEI